MSNQTPWTKERCHDRYVYGHKISLRALAVESGVPERTLARWSKAEDWTKQRQQFNSEVAAETHTKIKSKLAMSRAELSIEHFESYRQTRRVAECLLGIIEDKAQQIQSNHPELIDPEQLEETVKQLFLHVGNINQLSMVIDRAIEGERKAAGLEYEDLQKAANALKRRGFQITVAEGTEVIRIPGGHEVQPEDLAD